MAEDAMRDTAIRDLVTLFNGGTTGALTDGQLLTRFVEGRESPVFEEIVRRHGPMVCGVCRRVLRDHHDAEDAFQATFLVLARRAGSVRPPEMLGNWLYGVAYQTARKAGATRARRRAREAPESSTPEATAAPDLPRDDLAESLDRELGRLPERYRIAIVLCELEGMTHKDAAEHLGWPVGTVSSRLSRAKSMLSRRLSRTGRTCTIGALGAFVAQDAASAGVPPGLMRLTARAASLNAARRALKAGMVSAEVAALTGEVMKTMLLSKVKVLAGILMVAGLAGAGAGGILPSAGAQGPAPGRSPDAANDEGRGQLEGRADAPRAGGHPIVVTTVITDASALPLSTRCRVALKPGTDGQTHVAELVYEGRISEATAEGITLIVASTTRKEGHPSAFSSVPVVNRLVTNVGIAIAKPGAEEEVWIPAEKIRSVALDPQGQELAGPFRRGDGHPRP